MKTRKLLTCRPPCIPSDPREHANCQHPTTLDQRRCKNSDLGSHRSRSPPCVSSHISSMAVRWLSDGCPMVVRWCPMVVRWLSDGCPMAVRWLSDGCPMAVRWLSDGCPMVVRWCRIVAWWSPCTISSGCVCGLCWDGLVFCLCCVLQVLTVLSWVFQKLLSSSSSPVPGPSERFGRPTRACHPGRDLFSAAHRNTNRRPNCPHPHPRHHQTR